jgi:transcription elongation factor GreA
MGVKDINLSQEAYDKLIKELHFLSTTRRKEIALRFKDAFENDGFPDGDIMDEELFVENRIRTINDILGRAHILNGEEVVGDRVGIGSQVVLSDLENGEEMNFTLVGSVESDPFAQKLSEESPVGQAIKGKRAGQVVRVKAPNGEMRYKIVVVGNRAERVLPKVS